MADNLLFWLSILVGFLGLVVLSAVVWFGYFLFRDYVERRLLDHPLIRDWVDYRVRVPHPMPPRDVPRTLAESYVEYLQRRNEFWTMYGQILIAVLIVTVLSILLLTSVISAEAGLPILSGVSGFAIAKGVSGSRNISASQHYREERQG